MEKSRSSFLSVVFLVLLFLVLAMFLTSCGFAETARRNCHITDATCDTLFGRDQDKQDQYNTTTENNERDIAQINEQLNTLSLMVLNNIDMINMIQGDVSLLQARTNDLIARMVELEQQDAVIEYINPCGDGPGFDEYILKTKSGKYLAYFESGSKRFLTILTPGLYMTTDQQACRFEVVNNGELAF